MILSIALKEWKEFWRHRGMRLIVLSFLAIYGVSLLAGVVEYVRYERDRVSAEKVIREAWLTQGDKNPHAATYMGTVVFPKRSALSILEPGTLPYLGVAAYLRAHQRTEFVDLPVRDDSPLASLLNLTPSFCWQILFPFLIVLLTYSAFARDRETGMERYLLAIGSNRATLVFGKTLGVGLVVVATYLVAFGAGGLTASLVGGFAEEDVSAWLLLGLFYLMFSGTIFFLSLAISGLVKNTTGALTGGLVMWVLLCLVMPRWMADYGRVSTASPSAAEMARITELDVEKGFEDHPPREVRMETTLNMLFSELRVGRREDLKVNLPGFYFIAEAEVEGSSSRRRRSQARMTMAAQTEAMEKASTFSPATAMELLSTTLAGTAALQREALQDSADVYSQGFRRILNRELAAKGKESGGAMMSNRSLWGQVDAFEADLPSQIEAASERSRSIVTLLIWFTMAMLAAATASLVVPQMGDRS